MAAAMAAKEAARMATASATALHKTAVHGTCLSIRHSVPTLLVFVSRVGRGKEMVGVSCRQCAL